MDSNGLLIFVFVVFAIAAFVKWVVLPPYGRWLRRRAIEAGIKEEARYREDQKRVAQNYLRKHGQKP